MKSDKIEVSTAGYLRSFVEDGARTVRAREALIATGDLTQLKQEVPVTKKQLMVLAKLRRRLLLTTGGRVSQYLSGDKDRLTANDRLDGFLQFYLIDQIVDQLRRIEALLAPKEEPVAAPPDPATKIT